MEALAPRLRALAGLGLLLLIGASGATNAQDKAAILVLGDSISAAYGMPIERGWVTLLDTRLQQEGQPYRTINASISGETSAGGLRRLPELLRSHQPHTVIIELGGNDGLRGYPVGQLQSNLRQMISLSEETGAAVLVLPMEIPPNFGKYYTDAFRASFQDAVEGPVSYDFVSLLEDARRDVDDGVRAASRDRYLAAFQGLDPDAFDISCVILGAQRHCKVLGIFTRLRDRDGKDDYLHHVPRLWRLLERAAAHPSLAPLKHWLDTYIPAEMRIVPPAPGGA